MDRRTPLDNGVLLKLGDTEYEIISVMGFGGNAFVYSARYPDIVSPRTYHRVLVKELFPFHPKGAIRRCPDGHIETKEDARPYFSYHRESFLNGNRCHIEYQQARADQTSANINTYEFGGSLYTVFGDSNGVTLPETLKDAKSWTLLDMTYCIQGILDAVSAFHKQHLLHLDISPDNILLLPLADKRSEEHRRALLIDFNSVWDARTPDEGDNNLYYSLKDGYSAPELRQRQRRSICAATDLYSVCAIFYRLISGQPPDYAELCVNGVSSEKLRSLPALEGVPQTAISKVVAILQKGLRFPPNRRYQTAGELWDDLRELTDRIIGVGITHAALWEASKKQYVQELKNRAEYGNLLKASGMLAYVTQTNQGVEIKVNGTQSLQVAASGGMGKTTLLLEILREGVACYRPSAPVPIYIPLYKYSGSPHFLRLSILEHLQFGEAARSVEDALNLLNGMFNEAGKKEAHRYTLLLDGLNEAPGDLRPLLAEIVALRQKNGVRVVLTSRTENMELGLDPVTILEPTAPMVEEALAKQSLPYPSEASLQAIINNPLMLSIYIKTCTAANKALAHVSTAGELISQYTEQLLAGYIATVPGDARAQFQAEYAIRFLLPALADQLMRLERYSLSISEVYEVVKRCYQDLNGPLFRKVYPEYTGKTQFIIGTAKSLDDWFDDMVNTTLLQKLGLLLRDGGDYRLFHHNVCQSYSDGYRHTRRPFSQRKLKRRLTRCAISAMMVIGLVFSLGWIIRQFPSSYPKTSEERGAVERMAAAVTRVLGRTGLLMQNDLAALDAYEKEGRAVCLALAERNRATNETLKFQEGDARDYLTSRSPISLADLDGILTSAETYGTFSGNMYAHLQAVMAPDSLYPDADTDSIVATYRSFIENQSNACYARMQLITAPLNEDGRKLMLASVQELPIFRALFEQRGVNPNTSQLAASIRVAEANSKELITELKLYGYIEGREEP